MPILRMAHLRTMKLAIDSEATATAKIRGATSDARKTIGGAVRWNDNTLPTCELVGTWAEETVIQNSPGLGTAAPRKRGEAV